MTMLEARGVGYRIGDRAILRGVDLAVGAGELVVLAGPNGGGKTTLVRVMAGDVPPDSGEVIVEGRPISAYRPRELARRRAVLPQSVAVQFAFACVEVVTMGRAPYAGTDASLDDEEVVERCMLATETSHLAERDFRSLSGGEQSRVSLARVLAQETAIVLLDEPTAALDLRHQEAVMTVARALARQGRAVLAVLHDLNLAAAYADRIALLAGGELLACGDPVSTLEPDLLTHAYDIPVRVVSHPFRDCPLVVTDAPVDDARALASITGSAIR